MGHGEGRQYGNSNQQVWFSISNHFNIDNILIIYWYTRLPPNYSLDISCFSLSKTTWKQRTKRIIKLTSICKDYFYYFNIQILSCTSFNMNKTYMNANAWKNTFGWSLINANWKNKIYQKYEYCSFFLDKVVHL